MSARTSKRMVIALGPGRQVSVASPLVSRSPRSTRAWGARLGAGLRPGDVVGLVGELGAGKTLLAQAIMHGAGVDRRVRITSPTFALMNRYPGPLPCVHVDLYRLRSAAEAHEAGVQDAILGTADGLVVVEWFDRFPEMVPPEYLRVTIDIVGPTVRRLVVDGPGGDGK